MRVTLSLCIYAILATAPRILVAAQTPPPEATPSRPAATKQKAAPPARKALDPNAAARRSLGLSLLKSLSDEARGYRDETLRARVQARVADAIWEAEPETARDLFRRAWDAAEAVEGTAADGSEPSRPGRFSKSPTASGRPRTNLRMEILRLAAHRDSTLGKEFLTKLTAENREEAEQRSAAPAGQELSQAAINARLRLAGEFLESNDMGRALEFADPALTQISDRAVQFLVELREKNAAAADARFNAMLARAATDPSADANTVSLLTSYAFTPSVYLTVSETGIPSNINYAPRPVPDLSAELRAAFFRLAADVLLRPSAQLDRTSAGRAGTYYIITRLMPLFERQAPALVPALGAQLAALRPDAPRRLTEGDDPLVTRGITGGGSQTDALQDDLDSRLRLARSADERDRAYAFAAMRASDLGDPKAYEFVEKIEDTETRQGVRRFLDYNFIGALLRKKDWEEALRLARKGDLSRVQRVFVFTRAASLVLKTDAARARELLEEAVAEARRMDAGAEKAYSLVAVTVVFAKIDHARAWELAGEMVKAAEAAEDFTGENGRVTSRLGGKFSIQMSTEIASPSDFSDLFAALAEEDMNWAAALARNFTREAPRALAIIAVARPAFDKADTRRSH